MFFIIKMMNYYRRICFSIFDIEKTKAVDTLKKWKSISYCIVGREICPSTQREHLQCYCEFTNQVRFSTIKKKSESLNNFHFESSKGTPMENFVYCSKDGDFVEWGTRLPDDYKGQGSREDLRSISAEILNGKKVDDICLENPNLYHQYGRTLHYTEDIVLRDKYRTWMTTCEWIYGKTGTGKSEYAFKNFNPKTHYVYKLEEKFQDGYCGQEVIIIDEFRGQIPFSVLLRMIDKHPNVTLPRKCRAPAPFLARHVIITSSIDPCECYANVCNEHDRIDQLLRRIVIKEFK